MSKLVREDRIDAPVSSLEDARRRRQLDQLLYDHGDLLRRLAARLCRSSFDPDDLVQDVLERTVQHFDQLPAGVDHRAWMTRVMRNAFIDRLRRRQTRPTGVELDDDLATPPAEPSEWWERLDAEDIRANVRRLPDELRGAFELFALEGCSYQQIADRLGIPRSTVGTRVLRARRKLKQLFVDSHGGGEHD
ncbi:MAG: RNA polymerase sigma factor [Kofleriaceae bacterium]